MDEVSNGGDDINNAPALKQANVGTAMRFHGTDANFNSTIGKIEEGTT